MEETPEQLTRRQVAAAKAAKRLTVQSSLAEWAKLCGWQPAKHHLLLIEKLEAVARGEIKRLAIFLPPGSAKALALDTPIPTPAGWSKMGDLKVGDWVFNELGQPTQIVRVSPVFKNRPVYTIKTDCGDEIVADSDHQWLVRLCEKHPVENLKTSEQLSKKRSKRPMIARAKALECSAIPVPIDPYLLGVWLGDGTSASMSITASVEDQTWLRAELARLGYQTTSRSMPTLFGVSGVRKAFADMGLLHDPWHKTYGRKHIPAPYLRGSKAQRLALLQGLVDTDGTVCKKRGCTTFCNTNLELAEQFRELVRSLGVKAGWSEGRAKIYGKDCGPVYRVSFYLKDSARMPRKAALCKDQQRTPNTYVEASSAGFADTVCIEVDSPSHLFLAGWSMTPTHNSTYSSVLFPPWFLGQAPGSTILTCSHSADLAKNFGRRARNLIVEHSLVLEYSLTADSQAADEWSTTNGSSFFCAGVGGHIAGRRADLGLIDDPVGCKEDAYSKTIRDKTWDWYNFDFRTRLKPNARVVLVQTRWHEEDLAGKLLSDDKEAWEVINIPLIAEENDPLGRAVGERLWPEYFNEALVADAKKDSTVFNSLYQQNPTPESGDFFKREWIEYNTYTRDQMPPEEQLRFYCASDHAVSLDQEADLTCLLPVGVDQDDNIWVMPDLFWKRADTGEVVDAMVAMMKRRKPLTWWAEKGHISKSIGPFLTKRMQEERTYVVVEEKTPARDKRTRAQSIQGRMKMSKIKLPAFAPWYGQALHQLMSFDKGKHDDFVDALAWIGMGLDTQLKGNRKVVTPDWVLPPSPPLTKAILLGQERHEIRERQVARLDY